MSLECAQLSICNELCRGTNETRRVIVQTLRDRHISITSKELTFGHALDHPEVELPERVRAADAEDTKRFADASARLNRVVEDFNTRNEDLAADFVVAACATCPTRELDLSPLPTQE